MRALRGASGLPFGAGTFATSSSSTSSIPIPVLALQRTASIASTPIMSSISWATRSGSAEGKSILFRTGNTSKPKSMAV